MNISNPRFTRFLKFYGAVGFVLAAAVGAQAGEAIQFSGPSTAPSPGRPSVAADKARSGNGSGELGGLNSFAPRGGGSDPGRASTPTSLSRRDKKAQQAELERKNWMLLDRGELQAKGEAEEGLNTRGRDGERLDVNSATAELWFAPKAQNKAGRSENRRAENLDRDELESTKAAAANRADDGKTDLHRLLEQPRSVLAPEAPDRSMADLFRNNFGAKEIEAPARSREEFGLRTLGGLGERPVTRGESITFGADSSRRPASSPILANDDFSRPGAPSGAGLSDAGSGLRPGSGLSPSAADSGLNRFRAPGSDSASPFSRPSALSPGLGSDPGGRGFRPSFEVPARPR